MMDSCLLHKYPEYHHYFEFEKFDHIVIKHDKSSPVVPLLLLIISWIKSKFYIHQNSKIDDLKFCFFRRSLKRKVMKVFRSIIKSKSSWLGQELPMPLKNFYFTKISYNSHTIFHCKIVNKQHDL